MITGTLLAFFRSEARSNISARTLTFAERVAYQRAIEEVYWRHRIWPKERPDPKPSLDAVMSQAQLEKSVASYLRKSQALEDYWHRPITAEQLQAEMDRMAQHTKQPEVLRELFEALGNDPFVIAECLAGPVLAERLVTNFYAHDQRFHGELKRRAEADLLAHHKVEQMTQTSGTYGEIVAATANYSLPTISDTAGGCTDDTWTATSITNVPTGRYRHTAVWSGTEMIVWGGYADGGTRLNTGGRYNPSTDNWTATSTTNAPTARTGHTAVWTGSEMVVWGGIDASSNVLNTGGKYNPTADTWIATSIINAPVARELHAAVWTGSEMIIWGGTGVGGYENSGGRYNPGTDSWTATTTTNAPTARYFPTAVWTDSEMIVWGGTDDTTVFNTGGRYNPSTNTWTATSTANAPDGRQAHTAVWSGSEMIVWGGTNVSGNQYFDTGGRYNPGTNSWTATSTTNAPTARDDHTAVWTGSQMIIWGGFALINSTNTGGRYNPGTNSWTATSITNAPDARFLHTAVWTGSEMVVWGGASNSGSLNTGGRYCAQSGPPPSPTPTPTPTASPTPTATPTPTPTPTPCTGRCTPTPRPRPTPAPRPTPP